MAASRQSSRGSKHQQTASSSDSGYGRPPFKNRMALGAFIADPGAYPGQVIFYDDDFVAVRDAFPKATVHALLLPRRPHDALLQRPLEVLAGNEELLGRLRLAAERLRRLVAAELARELGGYSRRDERRQAVLDGEEAVAVAVRGGGRGSEEEEEEEEQQQQQQQQQDSGLPPGRDWAAEVRCGVHAVPSMRHLHVHVVSRDMHSASLRHRKHYNSFNTPFFVALHELPVPPEDPRRNSRNLPGTPYLARDLVCWRCGRNFGNQFRRLKEHLEAEFDEWKRE
ncbi:hypothetical protein CDD81_5820 [Ophiocordyceps australis]|uniref:Uncharacterized protein n=1 Tax=Ophiocordyceps australis TaxID=1399860 RepID=A0A2C5Y983_9HYPO|nr:hypothetical protein CDD81_5820 [Ophiocordyceps australis]